MAMHPEVERAVDDILNEAIIVEEKEKIAERQADQQERAAAQGSMNMEPEQPEQGAPQ